MIENLVKIRFKSWAAFARKLEQKQPAEFKRKFKRNINKINSWVYPLGVEIDFKNIKKDDKELTCIDCIYCEKYKDVASGYICEKNGCEIDDPNVDYCDTYFVLNK